MNREERRRAQRNQRRRTQPAARPEPRSTTAEPEIRQLVRQELSQLAGSNVTTRTADAEGVRTTAQRGRAEPRPAVVTASSLSTVKTGCNAVEEADPQALGLTYEFDAPDDGEPYTMTIGLKGRRTGLTSRPGPQDHFAVTDTIQVLPGSGRITVTKRVENISAGEWTVTARPVVEPDATPSHARPIPATAATTGVTGFAPIIRMRAPGARLVAWPSLVATGAAVALTVQALLAAGAGLPVTSVLLLSLLACLIGSAGARLYYMAEHPDRPRGLMNVSSGMCIQGFVLAAVGTVIAGAVLLGLPVGRLLDVTAPGLLFGMAIGRVGCFVGGCCAGRPTVSRWGLWSSDRRLGVRRIPTQLFESTMALAIGLAALLTMVLTAPAPEGLVFVAGIAAYTFGRQLLFPLRDQPRNTVYGRAATMAASGLIALAALITAVVA